MNEQRGTVIIGESSFRSSFVRIGESIVPRLHCLTLLKFFLSIFFEIEVAVRIKIKIN